MRTCYVRIVRFISHGAYARENYDPSLIEEQKDGSLLVTVYDAIDFKIVNLVLNEGGAVQVVSPPELAKKVIEQAKKVIEKQETYNQ